jgi:uncharacterized membrane protein (DUF106 family)
MADVPTIGDKIPAPIKPYIERIITAAITAAVTAVVAWLVGQGLLSPVQKKLDEQNAELKTANKIMKAQHRLQRASADYWAVPVPPDGE